MAAHLYGSAIRLGLMGAMRRLRGVVGAVGCPMGPRFLFSPALAGLSASPPLICCTGTAAAGCDGGFAAVRAEDGYAPIREALAPSVFPLLGCLLLAALAKPLQQAELLTVCYSPPSGSG